MDEKEDLLDVWERDFLNNCPLISGFLGNRDLEKTDEGTLEYLDEMLWLEINSFIRSKLASKFWKYFQKPLLNSKAIKKTSTAGAGGSAGDDIVNTPTELELFDNFAEAITELDNYYQFILLTLRHFDDIHCSHHCTNMEERLGDAIRSILLSQLPTNFNRTVYAFYNVSLKMFFLEQTEKYKDLSSSYKCRTCLQLTSKCRCSEMLSNANKVNAKLNELKLLDRLAGQCMTSLVKTHIKEYIYATYLGKFTKSNLQDILKWLDHIVINWLKQVFRPQVFDYFDDSSSSDSEKTSSEQSLDSFHNLKVKLHFYVYETYALSIIEQFIAIIIEYPDSVPIIADLKACMEKVKLSKEITLVLKTCLQSRLLHPGVNTMNILTAYVAAIKAIRYLDNSGVILETVTAPIKEYLRKRNDTVRCVVQSLTDETPTDLSEELAKMMNIDDGLANWETWQPQPVGLDNNDQPQATPIQKGRSTDVISMVVDIYGSKELFMNEYRNLLADRLLTQLDFKAEKEIRNLELLKLRFGESLLHNCEVMLKDMADSKRIDSHIQSDIKYSENKKFPISSLIISAQFWPPFNKESVELPEEIANEFHKYTKSYEEYKGNRTLNWRTVTGRVTIEIELGGRIIEMTVPPTQAVIIYHFQTKSDWSLEDLSNVVKMQPSLLRRRMTFWQGHGIITESQPGVYHLNEYNLSNTRSTLQKSGLNDVITEEEDGESAMASASDQREEELQVFWSYIVGMLTNLDSLPLERIHQMLKLFASNGLGVDFSQDELKVFLQRKVRDHKLIYTGGAYQLFK